jgi:hypothetical protein
MSIIALALTWRFLFEEFNKIFTGIFLIANLGSQWVIELIMEKSLIFIWIFLELTLKMIMESSIKILNKQFPKCNQQVYSHRKLFFRKGLIMVDIASPQKTLIKRLTIVYIVWIIGVYGISVTWYTQVHSLNIFFFLLACFILL